MSALIAQSFRTRRFSNWNICFLRRHFQIAYRRFAPPASSTAICFVIKNTVTLIAAIDRNSPAAIQQNSRFTERSLSFILPRLLTIDNPYRKRSHAVTICGQGGCHLNKRHLPYRSFTSRLSFLRFPYCVSFWLERALPKLPQAQQTK